MYRLIIYLFYQRREDPGSYSNTQIFTEWKLKKFMKHNLKANRQIDQFKILYLLCDQSTPVTARSKAWVCGRPPAETRFESCWGHGCKSLVSVVCCQVEISATG